MLSAQSQAHSRDTRSDCNPHASHSRNDRPTTNSYCHKDTSHSDRHRDVDHANSHTSDFEDVNMFIKNVSPSVLQCVQAEKNELRATNKNQERELANKENTELNVSSRSRKRKSVTQFTEAEVKEIKELAAKFTYMSSLWIRNLPSTFKLNLDDDYDVAHRFRDISSKCQGHLHDLLDVIPEKWHELMKEDTFYSIFNAEMNQQHSNGSTHVRHETGTAILSCKDIDLESGKNHFQAFGALIGWKPEGYYDPYCKILYKDYAGVHDLFSFNESFVGQAYKALVQGPSSVKNKDGSGAGKCLTLDKNWCIESVTPGAIAASAIYACFAASADDNFQPIGSKMKIPYLDDFELYLKFITDGLRLKKKFVLELIDEWNEQLYPSMDDGSVNGVMKGKNKERLANLSMIDKDLLEASEASEEEQEEANDDHDGDMNMDVNEGEGNDKDNGPSDGDGDGEHNRISVDDREENDFFGVDEPLQLNHNRCRDSSPNMLATQKPRPRPHLRISSGVGDAEERQHYSVSEDGRHPAVQHQYPLRQRENESTPHPLPKPTTKCKSMVVVESDSDSEGQNSVPLNVTVVTSAKELRNLHSGAKSAMRKKRKKTKH
ncbi:hypothetical protein M422DRAFT_251779 [Sphaerobolus stellatus SS14]|uniref:Uncharacterized protein n=1 Tax=Sphaerobolus stellatus (strain SS14) TaxID=990650 RepID=A0A0C9W059_SPHS4|nr:hypothetical protein M422DRAFT_251779 [Sphaerobolus stellatus SS14]